MNPSARIRRYVDASSALRRTLAMADRAVHHPVPVETVQEVGQRSGRPGPQPLVSVIIPCYNYAHFLPDAIGSALRQEGVDVEIIIVNDASTDDSAIVAASFQQRHPQVRLLDSETNTGHVVAFNTGYALARGEFIVRLDADDLLTPGSLLRSVTLFRAFPRVGLVYGHPRHFSTSTVPEAVIGDISWSIWSGEDWLTDRCRRGVNCITTPEAMVRGSVMAEVGPLRTELRFAQDMEMWFRVAAFSAVGRINGADQALHRDHAASMSVTVGAGRLVDLAERRLVYNLTFDAAGCRLGEPERMRSIAMRRLAVEALRSACHCYDRGRTDAEPVDELVEFAQATYPRWRELREWRALSMRRRMGTQLSRSFPPFTMRAAAQVMAGELAHARWLETGT